MRNRQAVPRGSKPPIEGGSEQPRSRRRSSVLATLAVLAILATFSAAITAQAPGHSVTSHAEGQPESEPSYGDGWRRERPIAGGPRQEHSVAALGEDVYVLGGIVPTESTVATTRRVEVYDTKRDRWSEAAPLPIAMNHPNVAVVRGRIYVLGGLSGGQSWQALPDAFVYEPRSDRWRRLPDMPAGSERGSAAVGVRDNKIYLAGGMRTLTPRPGGLQDTVNTVSSYDVRTGRWGSLPSLPEARDHLGGALIGSTFFVLGGRDRGQANVRDSVYALNLGADRWTERAPMPTPRGGIATATIGNRIYTFGGEGNPAEGGNGIFDETEVYDTARDQWRSLAPMPAPRHGTAAVAVRGSIYIPGGGDALGGAPVSTNDAYRPRGR